MLPENQRCFQDFCILLLFYSLIEFKEEKENKNLINLREIA